MEWRHRRIWLVSFNDLRFSLAVDFIFKIWLASVRCDGDENVFKSVERNGIWLNHAWFCERDHYKRFYTREWVKKEVKSLYKHCCYDVYTRIMARWLPMFIPQGTFYYLFSIILLKLLGFELKVSGNLKYS